MSFNIWGKTDDATLENIATIIKNEQVDIIGLQEAGDAIPKLAGRLRFFYSTKSSILSRYPIVGEYYEVGTKLYGAQIKCKQWRHPIYTFNSHLQAYPYGPYRMRDSMPVDESIRISEIEKGISFMEREVPSNDILLLLGDHNSPSHLDFAYPWPVSKMLADFGFLDSYRIKHPNVRNFPGLTWSPGYPSRPDNDTNDRIDYIYFRAASLEVLGSKTLDQLDFEPWPSDHRAIVTVFRHRSSSF